MIPSTSLEMKHNHLCYGADGEHDEEIVREFLFDKSIKNPNGATDPSSRIRDDYMDFHVPPGDGLPYQAMRSALGTGSSCDPLFRTVMSGSGLQAEVLTSLRE
jgi:hypothetical protein